MQDDHVYRKTELVGSSKTSLSDAIETAVARAAKTLRYLEWFEVNEIRGRTVSVMATLDCSSLCA